MKLKIKCRRILKNSMYWPLMLTILFVVMNIGTYFWDTKVGMALSVFIIIYFLVVLFLYLNYKTSYYNDLINFATQYGTVQRKLLEGLEVSYALLDSTGKILWVNQKFMEITGKDKSYHKSITGIFPSITREIIQKDQEKIEININYQNKNYRAVMDKIYFEHTDINMYENDMDVSHCEEQFLTVLYLFDETQLYWYINENKQQRMISALLYIDNYEEALDSIEEVKRSLLSALVDRKVNKYFSERDALIKKMEKDKYFIIFKQKYLDEFIKDKFSIIEDVKTIKVGNEMAITLSMGIGADGNSYNQNYEYSRMAIDLALGRGGDQVVVKEGENITYYGGKTRQVEKMTRVKARVKAHALREIIESKDRVVIMGHSIADMDSFGAAIGIYCAANVLGKKAHIVINEVTTSLRPIKEQFTHENGYPEDLFIRNDIALDIVDENAVLMVVDTNKKSLTECPELLNLTKTIVVFDHHRQGGDGIENAVLSYLETYASSTCEMVAEVLQYFSEKIHLKTHEADTIYAGILIDTDNFNTKTGVRTFEAAAYLRRCGAEVTRVRKMLRDDMSAYKARAEVVRNAEVYHNAFAISVCPGNGVVSPTIIGAQAANELLNVIGIKASFVLTDYNNKIYISSRSIDEVNVQLIMERIGGGGHLNVAGAQLTSCTMEDALIILKNTLKQMLEEGEIEI